MVTPSSVERKFDCTTDMLIGYMADYRRIRGWPARRIHITLLERMSLLMDVANPGNPLMLLDGDATLRFDGAMVQGVKEQEVVDRIREWDLAK